jgi:hypothetical protein
VRPSLRFLALAVVGWAGLRAATSGALPGATLFGFQRSEPKVPLIVPTRFPAVEPIQPANPMQPETQAAIVVPPSKQPPPEEVAATGQVSAIRYVQGIVGVPVAMRRGVVTVYQLPAPRSAAATESLLRPVAFKSPLPYKPEDYAFLSGLGDGPLSGISSISAPASHPPGVVAGESVPMLEQPRIDRVQLTSWALLRSQQTGVAGSRSLAPGGQLGASQAGARLVYNFSRLLALSGRLSSEVGRRGGEAAVGVRIHLPAHIPIWFTAERRQAIGRYGGGRNAFAFFAEGGVYQQPLPWRFALDTYFEAGLVSVKQHDLFFDGDLTVTRPLWNRFSAGFGIWGGAQPHLARLDVGPRVTIGVRKNLKVHLDWRQKLAGNARPGSGPALTLAGDF